MTKITAVTVNYNTKKQTIEFLNSIKKINTPNIELKKIVVDNGSVDIFPSSQKGDAILLRSEDNLGFTGGYNLGIKKALEDCADYVLVINNDTAVDRNFLVNLLKGFDKEKDTGLVVPKIYFAEGHEFHKSRYKKSDSGKVLWYAGGHVDWDNIKAIHRGLDEVDRGQFDRMQKITFATGCAVLVKKEVFEKIGFFDDDYFLYYEDLDFSFRAKRAGFEIVYAPGAIVYHFNASSTGGSGSGLHDYFLTRNQMLLGIKYAPLRSKLALVRQGLKLLLNGRKYQKKGIKDYYLKKFGKGSYFE